MELVISFFLISLMIWEFITWRGLTKKRRLIVEFEKAILRYIYRRVQLQKDIYKYLKNNNLLGSESNSYESYYLSFPEKDVTFDKLQDLIFENRNIEKIMKEIFNKIQVKDTVSKDMQFFYMVDEFSELQDVVEKCIEAHNKNYRDFNDVIETPPSSFLAKFLRIKPVYNKMLKQ